MVMKKKKKKKKRGRKRREKKKKRYARLTNRVPSARRGRFKNFS